MRPAPTDIAEIAEMAARLGGAPAEDILRWALGRFGARLRLASSFSIEDCVLIDMAHRLDRTVGIFALDTGRLPEETYQTADRVREKYGVEIAWYFPAQGSVEALERQKGFHSFMDSLDNRKECCGIRKVEPLRRALADADAWVTGLRREQAVTRARVAELEFDADHGGLAKLNPLAAWIDAQVWAYADAHAVPVNVLHQRGYPSIGCAPCTRAIKPGEPARAGRWWWEDPETKECGLHPVRGKAAGG